MKTLAELEAFLAAEKLSINAWRLRGWWYTVLARKDEPPYYLHRHHDRQLVNAINAAVVAYQENGK